MILTTTMNVNNTINGPSFFISLCARLPLPLFSDDGWFRSHTEV